MRIIMLTLAIAGIALSAASLKPEFTDNVYAYANAKSREFAKGDNGQNDGWRECAELESSAKVTGLVCEGTRTIAIHNGTLVDVNYFCEFRFLHLDNSYFRLDYSLCQ